MRKYYFKLFFKYYFKILNKLKIPKEIILIIIKIFHYYLIPLLFVILYNYGNRLIKNIILFLIFIIFLSQIYFKTCLIYEFEYFINHNNIDEIINYFEQKIEKNKYHVLPFCITALSFFLLIFNLN